MFPLILPLLGPFMEPLGKLFTGWLEKSKNNGLVKKLVLEVVRIGQARGILSVQLADDMDRQEAELIAKRITISASLPVEVKK